MEEVTMKKNYKKLSLFEFQHRFRTEKACRKYLEKLRWSDGFQCPHCGGKRHCFRPSEKNFTCYSCNKRTSLISGTIFHKTRVPLKKWFWMIYLIASSKKAASTLYLSQQLKISYKTTWLMRRKLQAAMAHRDSGWSIKNTISADEIFIGGKQTREERKKGSNKTAFFIALEEDERGNPKFLIAEEIPSLNKDLGPAIEKHIPKGTTLKTDGMGTYQLAAYRNNYSHQRVVAMRNPNLAHRHLRWINIVTSNLKRYLLSTHHGVFPSYRKNYVAEFTYSL